MQADVRRFHAPRTLEAFRALDAFFEEHVTDYQRRDELLDALTRAILSEFHAWPQDVTRRLVANPRSREAIRGWVQDTQKVTRLKSRRLIAGRKPSVLQRTA